MDSENFGTPGHYPVVVFIRAHEFPEFVADTIDAVQFFAETNPLIVVTVDRTERVARELSRAYPNVLYYTSKNNCGWGGGLFRLFCEAVGWLTRERRITFDVLWNIDYDLIPIRPGFDTYFQSRFQGSPTIGQLGRNNPNSSFWKRRMRANLNKLKKTFEAHGKQWPKNYEVGSHVAGACGIFKGQCVSQMLASGLLDPPFSDLGNVCQIADDPMLSLMVHAAGYSIREMGEKAYIKWRMETDYRPIPSQGYYVYHPTKLVPGNGPYSAATELACRNYFRKLRGQGEIRMLKDSPSTGRPNSITC